MIHPVQSTINHNGRWQVLVLLFVASAVLFPYGWLAEQWPLFSWLADRLFASEGAHMVGHFVLFAGFAGMLLTWKPRLAGRVDYLLLLVFALAVAQEYLQLVTFKHRPVGWNELWDVGVDMTAVLLMWLWWKFRQGGQLG
jgi:heme/copper-type cytochrome/quinol oxidase subunit 4